MESVPRYVFLYACNLVIIDLLPVTCPCHLKNPINRRRAGIIFDAPAWKNAAPRRRGATQMPSLPRPHPGKLPLFLLVAPNGFSGHFWTLIFASMELNLRQRAGSRFSLRKAKVWIPYFGSPPSQKKEKQLIFQIRGILVPECNILRSAM